MVGKEQHNHPRPYTYTPGDLVGTAHADRYKHKEKYKQYATYCRVDKAGVQLLQTIYNKTYFIDLHDNEGELTGYTTNKLLAHLKSTYIDLNDLEDDINTNEATFNANYDPSEAPEHYWTRLQLCQITATNHGEAISDSRIMRVAITQFRKHAELTDKVIDWKKKPSADRTWINFKIHFSKAIRRNNKDCRTFSKSGIANAAIESNVSVLAKATVQRSKTITALQTEIAALKAQSQPLPTNVKTNSVTTPTSVMEIIVKTYKQSQPDSVITASSKSKQPEWTKAQQDDSTGQRAARQYTHGNYCYRC